MSDDKTLTGGMFAIQPVVPPLTFAPVPQVYDQTGIEAWQATRGAFLYNVLESPYPGGGYDISIAYQASYLPRGPFKTLDEAIMACNRAAYSLEN